jgi:hypothetical protein
VTSYIVLRECVEFRLFARFYVLCSDWLHGYLSAVSVLGCEYVGGTARASVSSLSC